VRHRAMTEATPGPRRLRPARWWWDAIALTRPTLLIPLWTMHILGAMHAADEPSRVWIPPMRFVVLSLAHTLLMAAAYVVNQVADVDTDGPNAKLFLVADGLVSRRLVVVEIAALVIASMALVAIGGVASGAVIGLFAVSAGLGAAYSLPPPRLKARPVWDIVANALGYGCVAFAVGWVSVGPLTGTVMARSATYALCVAATFMFTTIPDIPGDAAGGARTSGVALGAGATAWVGVFLLAAALSAAVIQRQWLALPAAGLALPLYVRSARSIRRGDGAVGLTRATQVVILALSVAAAWMWPWYVGLLAVVIVWVRWYYRASFGVRYP
jgi:lycopene elongase/hydratase (dihydrobisanhydrobacterioruberin-forming)